MLVSSSVIRKLGVTLVVSLCAVAAMIAPAAAQQSGGFGDVPSDAYHAESVSALHSRGVFSGTLCAGGFCPGEAIDRKTMAVWIVRIVTGSDPPAVSESRFEDVDPGSFHAPFIERMAELGVTSGCGDGSGFCPDRTVTRAQMAVFLSRAYTLPDGPDPGFSDVPADAWYAADVARLAASGVTKGCGDGRSFCPDRDTTRGQMATFLWRAENPADSDSESMSDAPFELNNAMEGGGVVVAAGRSSCGLRTNRTILCWGSNIDGRSSPPEGNFTAISQQCAIRNDQTITCWGNESPTREITSSLNDDVPTGHFTSLSSSGVYACGVGTNRTITCWGSGRDDITVGPAGEFTSVNAGDWHACALRTDRSITCWGTGRHGVNRAPAGEFTSVNAGGSSSCALRTDGTIACWGYRGYGITDVPAGQFTAIATGLSFACGIRTDQTLACWGQVEGGSPALVAALLTGRKFVAISVEGSLACALGIDRSIACWHGRKGLGWGGGAADAPAVNFGPAQCSDGPDSCQSRSDSGSPDTTELPSASFDGLDPLVDGGGLISAGKRHSCAIKTDRTLSCWGDNDYGQADAPTGEFTSVSAGTFHSCALRTDGTIKCWGTGRHGENRAPAGEFTSVSAGNGHACALRTDGTIKCWGLDLGILQVFVDVILNREYVSVDVGTLAVCGVHPDQRTTCVGNYVGLYMGDWVIRAPDRLLTGVSVGAGKPYACGLRIDRTITCWGSVPMPRRHMSGTFIAVSAGSELICGLRLDQTVACWANPRWTIQGEPEFDATPPAGTFLAVSAGSRHACGIRTDQTIDCWGMNTDGQAGPPTGRFGPAETD